MIPPRFAEDPMGRFVEGIDREQATLFPECLEDWIDQDNPVRAIDAFVDKLDLPGVGFDGVAPEATGRPRRHPCQQDRRAYYRSHNNAQSITLKQRRPQASNHFHGRLNAFEFTRLSAS
jgi:hypothetical protein